MMVQSKVTQLSALSTTSLLSSAAPPNRLYSMELPAAPMDSSSSAAYNQTSSSPLKNVNIYWIFASSLAVWFLFVHSPPILIKRQVWKDLPFTSHLMGAYTIYLSCIINTVLTPSTRVGSFSHVWIGRIGMMAGLFSFVFGLYCAWWPWRSVKQALGFSIGITVGGVMQITTQMAGYRAIKKYQYLKTLGSAADSIELERAIKTHVYNMIGLFVAACGIPAALRLAGMFPTDLLVTLAMVGIISLLNVLIGPYGSSYFKS